MLSINKERLIARINELGAKGKDAEGKRTRLAASDTEKGMSVVPILQSICQWADIFYKEESDDTMTHCKKCDYH